MTLVSETLTVMNGSTRRLTQQDVAEAAGSGVLRPVLEEADRLGSAAVLETSAEANLPFYRRLGFEVAGETDVPSGGPHVWAMRRPPRRPALTES